MPLSANWQILLQDQLMRGIFFMHPQMALGMVKQFSEFAIKEASLEELRADFQLLAMDHNGDEYSVYDEAPQGSVARFLIHGPMLKYGTWYTYGTLEIADRIREAGLHKNISAIVIDYDTGGGVVSSIPPLSQAIADVRKMGKPVLAEVDLCCSAGLWSAADCDWIIAKNSLSCEIGSIGVMADFWDIAPYYESLGLKHHRIESNLSEDKNKPFNLALAGDYDLIKTETLDPLALKFQNHIKSRREGKIDESAPGILTGRTVFAEDALKYGLIDEIGTGHTAIERAIQLTEVKNFINTYK